MTQRQCLALSTASGLALAACLFPSLGGLPAEPDAATDAWVDALVAPDGDGGLGTYVAEVTADAPASWWRLGEKDAASPAADEMGAFPGAYRTPGVTLGVKGAIKSDTNTAVSYSGSNGSMFATGSAYDLAGTVSFAIEVWVCPPPFVPNDTGDNLRRIASHRTSSDYGWYLAVDSTQSLLFTRWNGTEIAQVSSSPVGTNVYSHVVVSSDGTTLVLYVNGAQQAAGPAGNITTAMSSVSLAWGSQSDFSAEWFNGELDEAAIYTHALSAARVLAHYQAGIQ